VNLFKRILRMKIIVIKWTMKTLMSLFSKSIITNKAVYMKYNRLLTSIIEVLKGKIRMSNYSNQGFWIKQFNLKNS
jgi:hypothetical protein